MNSGALPLNTKKWLLQTRSLLDVLRYGFVPEGSSVTQTEMWKDKQAQTGIEMVNTFKFPGQPHSRMRSNNYAIPKDDSLKDHE